MRSTALTQEAPVNGLQNKGAGVQQRDLSNLMLERLSVMRGSGVVYCLQSVLPFRVVGWGSFHVFLRVLTSSQKHAYATLSVPGFILKGATGGDPVAFSAS